MTDLILWQVPKRRALVPPFASDTVAGQEFWFKADSLALADTTAVQTWSDSSGNGRGATQATEADRPTFHTSVLNGRPVLRFANNQYLRTAVIAALPQPTTYFLVGNITGSTVANRYFIDAVTLNSHVLRSAGTFDLYGGALLVGPASDNATHIFNVVYNGASSLIRVDGGAGTTGAAGAGTCDGFTIGASGEPTAAFLFGDIAEIILYSGSLSVFDTDTVASYLAMKYNLTWTGAS